MAQEILKQVQRSPLVRVRKCKRFLKKEWAFETSKPEEVPPIRRKAPPKQRRKLGLKFWKTEESSQPQRDETFRVSKENQVLDQNDVANQSRK